MPYVLPTASSVTVSVPWMGIGEAPERVSGSDFHGFSASETGGVAYGAHLGGFIAGMLLIPFFKYRHVRLFSPGRSR